MAKFKNTIGTGFPEYVTKQLESRRKIVSKTTRDQKDLLWLSNRVGWYRMTSGALIDGKDDLAKNNVLQGSIQSKRGGFKSSYENGPLGFKPTPGITSLSVGTGGRWQTLLQGEVEFIAYDLNQLETLSKLYMSLGVHVFIEWGHKPYIVNDSIDTSTDINPVSFFSDEFSQNLKGVIALQQKVNAKKETKEGNYEALIGRVYNFDYNANPDGSYTCKIKVMGAGAMADSLRLSNNRGKDNDLTKDNESPKKNPSALANALVAIKTTLTSILKPNEKELLHIDPKNFRGTQINEDEISYGDTLNKIYTGCNYTGPTFNEKTTSPSQNDFQKKGNAHQLISYNKKDNLKDLDNIFYTGYVSSLKHEETGYFWWKDTQQSSYITLGHLFCLVQHLGVFVDTEGKQPAVYLDYHPENTLIRTGMIEASVDPSVCLVPFKENPPVTLKKFLSPLNTEKPKIYSFQKNNPANIDRNFTINKDLDKTSTSILTGPSGENSFSGGLPFNSGRLFNILVNIDFAYDTLISIQESNKDKEVMLREYLEKILNGINIALGKNNNFKIVSNDCGLVLRVIDESYIPEIDEKKGYITIPPFGKESIAYDYSYSSKISKNLSSQIVIASQAQSKKIKDFPEDVLTYFKLNNKVSDRFTGIIEPPDKEVTSTSEETSDEKKERVVNERKELRLLQNLYDQFYKSYTMASTGPIGKGVGASLTNLYSTLQQKLKNQNCGVEDGEKKGKFTGGILIPLEMSITIDGMSGILPYNAFLLPNNRLPERYKDRVAFIVFSINHSFDNNQWKTTLRGQTIIRPDKST